MRASGAVERGSDRGWGPFTGRQLTTIIVAVVVMVLFPVGAWAVSSSNIFVTDAGSGVHASVNSAGALTVAQASARNFVFGATNPANKTSSGFFTPVLTASATHAVIVTSITVDVFKDLAPGPGEDIDLALSKTDATCNEFTENDQMLSIADVNPATVGVTVLPFQPGIVIPANRSLCVANEDETNLAAEVYAYGYIIPAASAPVGALEVPSPPTTPPGFRNPNRKP